LTVIVAPLTTGGFTAPFRVPCRFDRVSGQVALDHLRGFSKARCLRLLGKLDEAACQEILRQLRDMFSS